MSNEIIISKHPLRFMETRKKDSYGNRLYKVTLKLPDYIGFTILESTFVMSKAEIMARLGISNDEGFTERVYKQ
jgi:hypothetical protein